MYKIIVFAGTTEGCKISQFLAEHQISVCACVATEYGSKSLSETEYLKVRSGRMTAEEMSVFLSENKPELVLDATHPYAVEVTANVVSACEQSDIAYVRVLRDNGEHADHAVYVESVEGAVEYLKNTSGNILLTTGSKELAGFTALPNYQERLFARVLSLTSVMEACTKFGIEGKHLIGMQGPFSKEMNAAILRQYECDYLVTKDSGAAGGFQEKIDAAEECGVTSIIIGRPSQEEGISLHTCIQFLRDHFEISAKPQVTLVGIGMGSEDTLTIQGKRAVESADLLIGAKRMVDAVKKSGQDIFYEYKNEAILSYIKEHPEYQKIAVVLSGDVGFYSGAKKLVEALDEKPQIICGISSVAYFMSQIGLSWDDAELASVHGRNCNLISLIKHHRKVFSILGTKDGIAELAKKLVYYNMGSVLLYVGENLSYDNEKIFVKEAVELTDYVGDALCVVCAYNENACSMRSTHGIPDSEFVRGKAPMTKEEVRTVSLSKLQLTEDSICYDIGAGTGSVSVEMALRARQGKVFAIEKKEEAAELLEINRRKFAVDHLEIIRGYAPEALGDLPSPTHAFIGGSSGNMRQILDVLLEKNPDVRIVINCIALETVSETLKAIQEIGFEYSEIVQLGAARAKELGTYHMMMGENPIYIITCQHLKGSKAE